MNHYSLYGKIFESTKPIEFLVPAMEYDVIDCRIVFESVPVYIKKFSEENNVYGKKNDAFWFKNRLGIFFIESGNRIVVEMYDGIDYLETIPFVLGYCIAILFSQQSLLAIHCSSICYRDKGLLIVGQSGAGKSTLTSRFLENGAQLLSDDIAIIDSNKNEFTIFPGFPKQNLCLDAIKRYNYNYDDLVIVDEEREKYAIIRNDKFRDSQAVLSGVIVIIPSEVVTCEIVEVIGTRKLEVIIDNLFVNEIYNEDGIDSNILKKIVELVKQIPVYTLYRPQNIDSTIKQMELINNI